MKIHMNSRSGKIDGSDEYGVDLHLRGLPKEVSREMQTALEHFIVERYAQNEVVLEHKETGPTEG